MSVKNVFIRIGQGNLAVQAGTPMTVRGEDALPAGLPDGKVSDLL